MPQFYTLLTDTGQAKLANAVALGGTIEITELSVGDGNGSLPTPDSSATALINEVRRAPINASQTDPDNPSWIVVEQVLPPDVGGWTIREIGIYDVDGDLIGIGNYPETYKPVLAEGSSRTQTVRFVLEVSDTSAVTLKVDPSVVLATRGYVDDSLAVYGLGEADPGVPLLDDFANTSTPTGFYRGLGEGSSSPTPNAPPGTGNSKLSAYALHVGGSVHWIVLENAGNATTAHRMFFGNTHNGGVIWNRVWHDGNVGAGSGLDADLLDGQHGSYYRNASNLNAGKVPVARLPAATETAIGAVEKADEDEAKSGAAGKHPDAAGVHAAFNQYGLGSGQAVGNTDVDTLTDIGLFWVSSVAPNLPDVSDGSLLVGGMPNRPFQMFTAFSDNRTWTRTLTVSGDFNSWSSWQELYHSGNLATAFNGAGLQSLGTSGHQNLPGGLILQWVRVSAGNNTGGSWPIAFPNACLSAWPGAVIESTDIYAFAQVTSFTRTAYSSAVYGQSTGVAPGTVSHPYIVFGLGH